MIVTSLRSEQYWNLAWFHHQHPHTHTLVKQATVHGDCRGFSVSFEIVEGSFRETPSTDKTFGRDLG